MYRLRYTSVNGKRYPHDQRRKIVRPLLPLVSLSLLIVCTCIACTSIIAPTDLSTDEGVRRAYQREIGEDVPDDDFCVKRPSDLQDIVLVGYFAHDAGCRYGEVFVGHEFGRVRDMTAAGLLHNGWVDESRREELAIIWADDVIFVEDNVLKRENDEFTSGGKPFIPPTATLNDDGGVSIELWVVYDGGMLPEATYKLQELSIRADGSLEFIRVADEFTIEY